eukprot:gnl/TRDRNA2_/TRDRNA2_150957_c0_seq1.p1 gnl/TRDRNA2_/TRDRNA2_150957_c0~~gnl/TRDRNA2_/TRDRNA2_150957_c0_seq1.p1  ORF type:complete len:492 (+),score=68.28 gnl/TRDRNA2_/TRDRNA2_150957_c0_seq1:96-1571(+)
MENPNDGNASGDRGGGAASRKGSQDRHVQDLDDEFGNMDDPNVPPWVLSRWVLERPPHQNEPLGDAPLVISPGLFVAPALAERILVRKRDVVPRSSVLRRPSEQHEVPSLKAPRAKKRVQWRDHVAPGLSVVLEAQDFPGTTDDTAVGEPAAAAAGVRWDSIHKGGAPDGRAPIIDEAVTDRWHSQEVDVDPAASWWRGWSGAWAADTSSQASASSWTGSGGGGSSGPWCGTSWQSRWAWMENSHRSDWNSAPDQWQLSGTWWQDKDWPHSWESSGWWASSSSSGGPPFSASWAHRSASPGRDSGHGWGSCSAARGAEAAEQPSRRWAWSSDRHGWHDSKDSGWAAARDQHTEPWSKTADRVESEDTDHDGASADGRKHRDSGERSCWWHDSGRDEEGWAHPGGVDVRDLQVGMKTEGEITNITRDGVFVNIGAKKDGFLTASQAKFLEREPRAGVRLWHLVVSKVDLEKNRVSLQIGEHRTAGASPGPRR